jgi:hypothetical protein
MADNEDINDWTWWQDAQENPQEIGKSTLPVHEDSPNSGYFRVKTKEGNWEPVAIWVDDAGNWLGLRGGNHVKDVNSLWVWSCRHPIPVEAYERAIDGKGWEDEPPAAAGIGDNSGDADPSDALKIEYLGEKELAEEFLKTPVKSQADADRSAIWAKRLSDISNKATAFHKTEKQPSLDEGRRIDERWRELKEDAKALSTKLKRHTDAWLNDQARIEQERQRKAREEAERIRAAAEEAERKAAETVGESDEDAARARNEAERLAEQAKEAARQAEARAVTAGRTGAKTSLRTFVSAEITDYDALLMALKDREEIKEIVQSLANRAAKAGVALAGMKIVEERRAV